MSENLPEAKELTPMSLLVNAQKAGASIEQMQQLMDLQERWEKNEARKQYNQAMGNFRAECPTIDKTRKGHNTTYAGLAESIEQIKDILAKNGLSYSWKTNQKDGKISVECVVTHKNGHFESTSLEAEPDKTGSKNSIQAIGSTVAYLERYTLFAMLGLASKDMDDDGNRAGSNEKLISDEQAANIDALVTELGVDLEKFLTWCRVPLISDIPAKNYNSVIAKLEERRSK